MKRKRELDRTASENTGIPPYVVKLVTAAWIEAIQAALTDDGAVHLDLLGSLRVTTTEPRRQVFTRSTFTKTSRKGVRQAPMVVDVPTKVFVRFNKSDKLKEALAERYSKTGVTSGKSKSKR